VIGIYSLTNRANGKVYIGQSWDIATRFRDYKGYRAGSHLAAAFKKYGIGAFHFGIVMRFPETVTQEELDRAEDDYIIAGDRMNRIYGYNMRRGGSHGKHSEESRKLLGDVTRGRKHSDETKRKIGEKSKGRYYSPEARAKIGAAHQGMKFSAEALEKMRQSHLGKKQKPESIVKMLEWRRLHYQISEATCRKIGERVSASKRGKPWSVKQRAAFEARRIS